MLVDKRTEKRIAELEVNLFLVKKRLKKEVDKANERIREALEPVNETRVAVNAAAEALDAVRREVYESAKKELEAQIEPLDISKPKHEGKVYAVHDWLEAWSQPVMEGQPIDKYCEIDHEIDLSFIEDSLETRVELDLDRYPRKLNP